MNGHKHTPGPWTLGLGRTNTNICAAALKNNRVVATVHGSGHRPMEANSRLIAAAPDLLHELEKANRIIHNALQLMTPEQTRQWGIDNDRDNVDGEGITRRNERDAVIAKTKGA